MRNYIQTGDVIDHIATTDILSGDVVVIGQRVGVAITDIIDTNLGPVQMTGVIEVPKKSADTIPQGALVYWDDTNNEMTTTSESNTLAGYSFLDVGSGDTEMQVKLNA